MADPQIPVNRLRARLGAGERGVGTMVAEFRQPAVMQLLANAGFDFVIIDGEHGPFGPETVADLVPRRRRLRRHADRPRAGRRLHRRSRRPSTPARRA